MNDFLDLIQLHASNLTDSLRVVSDALVILLLCAIAFFAYEHWRISRERLSLELFERRYSIYVAARKLLSTVFTTGNVTREQLFEFDFATRESRWLFGPQLEVYLSESLSRKAGELQVLAFELDVVLPPEKERIQAEQGKIREWFAGQVGVMDEKFSKYLQMGV